MTGNNEIKIKTKMERAKFMAYETKRRGSYSIVGYANMSVQLLLLEMTVKPTLLASTETWCNVTAKEEALITSHHHEILCIIFGQPKGTSYYGILGETGIWPYKYVIIYKKLMFLHHIIHSSDGRIVKTMVKKQQQLQVTDNNNTTWYAELNNYVRPMNININTNVIEKKLKSEWKKEVKEKLHAAIEKEFHDETKQKTKLRFQRNKSFSMEEYVKTCDAEMVRKIMNLRLNMVECKSNFKNMYTDTTCIVCEHQQETTEHLLECSYYKQFAGNDLEPISEEKLESVEWLVKAARVMDVVQEIRRQHIQR